MKHQGITPLDLEMLLPAVIFGAEGEGEGEGEGGDPTGGEDGGAGSGDDPKPGTGEHDDADDPKVKGLKSALEAERKRADAAEKKLKAEAKAKEEAALKEKSEIEQAQIREQAANERSEKLAAGLLRRDIDAAIKEAAKTAGFIDVTDAIDGVDRKAITAEQDADDPTNIRIDQKTVDAVVKALATKKPHFLSKGTEDGEPTGGQFGRGNSRKKRTSEESLKEKYPSL